MKKMTKRTMTATAALGRAFLPLTLAFALVALTMLPYCGSTISPLFAHASEAADKANTSTPDTDTLNTAEPSTDEPDKDAPDTDAPDEDMPDDIDVPRVMSALSDDIAPITDAPTPPLSSDESHHGSYTITDATGVETEYATLSEAIAAANASSTGGDITLHVNTEEDTLPSGIRVALSPGRTLTMCGSPEKRSVLKHGDYQGSMFDLTDGTTLRIENLVLDGQKDTIDKLDCKGGFCSVEAGATLAVSSGTVIKDWHVMPQDHVGSVVYLSGDGASNNKRATLRMESDAQVSDCHGDCGGFLYQCAYSRAEVTDNARVENCEAKKDGGFAFLEGGDEQSYPKLTLAKSCSFSEIHAEERGGVICTQERRAKVIMKGKARVENARAHYGGVIYLGDGDQNDSAILFVWGNTTIQNASAQDGGFVFMGAYADCDIATNAKKVIITRCHAEKDGGAFFLDGPTSNQRLILGGDLAITECTAQRGAACYCNRESIVSLAGSAKITNNVTSIAESGAVHPADKESLIMLKEGPSVKNNTDAQGATGKDIYVDTHNKIYVTADLTGEESSIGIWSERFGELDWVARLKQNSPTIRGVEKTFVNTRNPKMRACERQGEQWVFWSVGPLCKVIGEDGEPRVFFTFKSALNYVGDLDFSYRSKGDDGVRIEVIRGTHLVEKPEDSIILDDYRSTAVQVGPGTIVYHSKLGRKIILTSAKVDAADGFPLQEGTTDEDGITKAVIKRHSNDVASLIDFHEMTWSDFETRDIIFDGGSNEGYCSTEKGNVLYLPDRPDDLSTPGSTYRMGKGTTIQNARGTGEGSSAIYMGSRSRIGTHSSAHTFYMCPGSLAKNCVVEGDAKGGGFAYLCTGSGAIGSEARIEGGEIRNCDATRSKTGLGGAMLLAPGFISKDTTFRRFDSGYIQLAISGDTYIHDNQAVNGSAIGVLHETTSNLTYESVSLDFKGNAQGEGIRIIDNRCTSNEGTAIMMFDQKLESETQDSELKLQGKIGIENNITAEGFSRSIAVDRRDSIVVTGDLDPSRRIGVWGIGVGKERNNVIGDLLKPGDQFAITENEDARAVKGLSALRNECDASACHIGLALASHGIASEDNAVAWAEPPAMPVQVRMTVDEVTDHDLTFVAQLERDYSGNTIRVPFVIAAGKTESEAQTIMLPPFGEYDVEQVSSHDDWIYKPQEVKSLNDEIKSKGAAARYRVVRKGENHDMEFCARKTDMPWLYDQTWSSIALSTNT